VLIIVLFADVVIREVTGTGFIWARQAGVYANLILTLVGMGIASAEGAHLRPRFADTWLPRAWEPALARLSQALMALFCLAFAAIGAEAVVETRLLDERTAMPPWPVWPFQLVIPLAFTVACLRHAAYAAFPRQAPTSADPPGPVRGDERA
jgi:TRAP-type C4-dicarboxylate transport system permease small subunit